MQCFLYNSVKVILQALQQIDGITIIKQDEDLNTGHSVITWTQNISYQAKILIPRLMTIVL